jgi:hypothetical protein
VLLWISKLLVFLTETFLHAYDPKLRELPEMRLKLVFWQAEKDNELYRLVIQPTKKSLTFSPECIKSDGTNL